MAKKQTQHEAVRYAVNKKQLKKAREISADERAQREKSVRNREKSRRMGSAFLLGVSGLIGLFCLYTLLRTLLVRRAASVEELHNDLLFVSIVSIPFLLGSGAVLVHRLLKKQREGWSDRIRRLSSLFFVLALVVAFVLFGVQLRGGRTEASRLPAYENARSALAQSGLELTEPEDVSAVKALLDLSFRTELHCGKSTLRLTVHADSSGWIVKRFWDQAVWDYRDFPIAERGAAVLWGPVEENGSTRAALAVRQGNEVRIYELSGPAEELNELLPLLAASEGADAAQN